MNRLLPLGIAALLVSAQAPAQFAAPKPDAAPSVEQQELVGINQLCELAKYASRINADQLCQHFLPKYQALADEAEKKKIAAADATSHVASAASDPHQQEPKK